MGNKAIIIGAGIGGLAAAIALQKEGWDITVVDKASSLRGVGAGIVLAANAIKALEKLGLSHEVCRQGAPVGMAEIRTWEGKLIMDLPTTYQAERNGSYSYLIHRASLQSILLNRVNEFTSIQLNKTLHKLSQNDEKVRAFFEDGTEEEADLFIGADGIHSTVRNQLFGNVKPCYAGYTALRGICTFEDQRYKASEGGGFEAWGAGKRFGFSQLGQGQAFWFAAINSPQNITIPLGEKKNAALRHFQGWYKPIEEVIRSTDESVILHHDIFDRKPLANWSKGRITLLGDAAHPMLPNLGQGGAQALEDAIVLARCLGENDKESNIRGALLVYERVRKARTTKIVKQSRRMGRLVQLENPLAIAIRNTMLRASSSQKLAERMNWKAGHQV